MGRHFYELIVYLSYAVKKSYIIFVITNNRNLCHVQNILQKHKLVKSIVIKFSIL